MIARGLALKESIDGFKTLGIEGRDIGLGDRAVVGGNGVDCNIQWFVPARTQIALLAGRYGDQQQHAEQNRDAQHLETAARPRRRSARH